ncbi:MAG: glycosyltransferase family 87 protein [Syntrophobacter sp.]
MLKLRVNISTWISNCSTALVKVITPDRLTIYPITILAISVTSWITSQCLGKGLLDASGCIIGSDFLAFYNAGKIYLMGQLDNIYNINDQIVFQKSITYPYWSDNFSPFINPPFIAIFFSLFSHHNYIFGLILWWLFGLCLFLATTKIIKYELRSLNLYNTYQLMHIAFLFPPTWLWFIYGQNTSISLFLYTVGYLLLRRGKDFYAGLFLGLLIYKPQLGIGITCLLLFKSRFSAVAGTILSAGICVAVCFAASKAATIKYLEIAPSLMDIIRLHGIGIGYPTWGVHSFFGFSSLLLDSISVTLANWTTCLLTIAGISFIFFISLNRKWDPPSRKWDTLLASTFAVGLLISPHLFSYDLMLLLLPLAIIWNHYPKGGNNKPLDGEIILSASFLLFIFCFIGGILSKAQLEILRLLGLADIAVQISTFVIFGWAYTVITYGQLHPNTEPQQKQINRTTQKTKDESLYPLM